MKFGPGSTRSLRHDRARLDAAGEDVAVDEIEALAARAHHAVGIEGELVDPDVAGAVSGGGEGALVVPQLAELRIGAARDDDDRRLLGAAAGAPIVREQRREEVGGVGAGAGDERRRVAAELGGDLADPAVRDEVGVALHRRDRRVELERAGDAVGTAEEIDARGRDVEQAFGVARHRLVLEGRQVRVEQRGVRAAVGAERPAARLGGRGEEELGVGAERGELAVVDRLGGERGRDRVEGPVAEDGQAVLVESARIALGERGAARGGQQLPPAFKAHFRTAGSWHHRQHAGKEMEARTQRRRPDLAAGEGAEEGKLAEGAAQVGHVVILDTV